MRTATIYVDGSCLGNGQPDAAMGIGVYWASPSNPRNNISEPLLDGLPDNQRAELEAARRGILQCRELGYKRVIVRLDSRYVQKGAEEWIPYWELHGYPDDRRDVHELVNLRDAMEGIDVRFQWIPSEDNLADPLARRGASQALGGCWSEHDIFMTFE